MNSFDRLMDVIGRQLSADGFTRPSQNVFVKQTVGSWRAWIGITGNAYILSPVVGVFSQTLIDIRTKALGMLGRKPQAQADGPPLVMANLERIAPSNSACSQDAAWHYSGAPLTEDAANELIVCLREHAYPFFEAHVSLQSIADAAKAGMGGHALPDYLPIILIELGLHNELASYIDGRALKAKNEKRAQEYREYVNVLLKMLS